MSAGVSSGVSGGFAAIGGGAASFLPAPLNLHDLASTQLVTSCMRQVQSRRRKSISASFMDAQYEGPNREGALFCRTGAWMEILDEPAADDYVRRGVMKKHSLITGTRQENSPFSVLEFLSVAFGLVSIRGKESQRYLCMDSKGRLYGAAPQNYSTECVFMEEMLENYYNLYSSCAYGQRKRRWYVALKKSGRPRRGKKSRKRRKSSHFLVVHFDGTRMMSGSGYMMARRNNDGSVEMLGARGGRREDDHSRFGGSSRDSAWREQTDWRNFVRRNGRLPTAADRGLVIEDVVDDPVGRSPPSAPPIGIVPVPSLSEILAGSVRKQNLLAQKRLYTASQQQPAIVAENLNEQENRLLRSEQRRRRRRKEGRLEREERRREKRKRRLQQLRQQEQG
uniref:Fibroblast growth factor n=1 Tax=Plectus sambesii TaxID=2011161 RepID=A0A914WVD3_9BILA